MPLFPRDGAEPLDAPDRLPVLPLRDLVVFPHVVIPLLVGRQASLAALDTASADAGQLIFLVAQKNGDVEEPGANDLFRVGVIARIHHLQRSANGTTKVLLEGLARARVTRFATAGGMLRASLAPMPLELGLPADADPQAIEAVRRRALALFEEYVGLNRRLPDEVLYLVQATTPPERQAWGIAAHLGVRHDQRQSLIEAEQEPVLWGELATLLDGEIEILRLERKIDDDVRGSLFQNQREFYLQEQLKAIHRELGNEDDDLAELEAQLLKKGLPDVVLARAQRELRRLRRIPPMNPESTVARTFVDWVLALPWNERSDDVVDVESARHVLDDEHHGLVEVKERILDFIAVLALVGKVEGPVLCLVGPPGVGKTSLGRSIAKALGRRFVRMSLGGVRDEAEIRGHRRTYIGSMPGRIVQAMRRAEVVNPVILLDEVDKLGHDWRGDPAAALLEVLDPEQNRSFSDHYLELDYDLSQVLFITTANSLAQIPEPLRDRMEIIRIPGYLDQEKLAIAERFLVPRQLVAAGLDPASVTWEPGALHTLLRGWTREAGVRDLERRIARVARKLARKAAEAKAAFGAGSAADDAGVPPRDQSAAAEPAGRHREIAPVTTRPTVALVVRKDDLHSFLGPAPYDPDDTTVDDKVGVVTGLAYTAVGGETLEIEVSTVSGRGKLQLTGTLGDVMKESASAALSYIRARAGALGLPEDFHRTRDIHVHIPAGATPKDGPSAGIAMGTAIVSALTGRPARGTVAMTGEITLRGRVLPIGGLKEKSVAAHRAQVTDVVIPHGNARDIEELPEEVRRDVRFHPVKTMDEVLAIALHPATAAAPAGEVPPVPPARPSRGRKAERPTERAPDRPAPIAPPPSSPGRVAH
jgi:ATP-dependent Lon protease